MAAFFGVTERKGFIQPVIKDENYEMTNVIPLLFISALPYIYDTVYTALQYATDILICLPAILNIVSRKIIHLFSIDVTSI